MRPRLKAFMLLIPIMLLVGCPHLPRLTNTFSYDVGLESVERPADAKERYGDTTISTPDQAGKYWFEDGMIRSAWIVTDDRIAFEILNKTEHSIKIVWDEAAFVDTEGKSGRITHEGVKFVDASASQPPSVIPKTGRINDSIVPVDNISFSQNSGWKVHSLFTTERYDCNWDYTPTAFTADDVIQRHDQKTVQVLLPLEIEGVVNEYLFAFRILKVTATDVR